jgi:hypothetical protein
LEVDTVPASVGAVIGPEDYVDDAHLPHILALLEENTRRVTKKVEEWKREAMLQDAAPLRKPHPASYHMRASYDT